MWLRKSVVPRIQESMFRIYCRELVTVAITRNKNRIKGKEGERERGGGQFSKC